MSGRHGSRHGRRQRGNPRGSAIKRGINKSINNVCVSSPFSPPHNIRIGNLSQNSNEDNSTSKRRTRDQWEANHHVSKAPPFHFYSSSESSRQAPQGDALNLPPVTPERKQLLGDGLDFNPTFDLNVSATSSSSTDFLAVITQTSDSEMETDMEEDDGTAMFHSSPQHTVSISHQNKRARLDKYNFPLRHAGEVAMENFNSSVHRCWWKSQKQSRTSKKSTCTFNLELCHVCNNATTGTKQPLKENGQKQANSLLSYFNRCPNKSKSSSCQQSSVTSRHPSSLSTSLNTSKTKASSKPSPNSQLCSYCDRPACNSCMKACEGGCNLHFCTFCSTINYDGPRERVLCFNCNEGSGDFDCPMVDTSIR